MQEKYERELQGTVRQMIGRGNRNTMIKKKKAQKAGHRRAGVYRKYIKEKQDRGRKTQQDQTRDQI